MEITHVNNANLTVLPVLMVLRFAHLAMRVLKLILFKNNAYVEAGITLIRKMYVVNAVINANYAAEPIHSVINVYQVNYEP